MINNTEHNEGLWTFENPKSIILKWDELPFNTKTSIRWRGQLIHIEIKAFKTEYGWTRVITFLYQDKLYHCRLTKWKWSGGGNGVYPPEIATSIHNLKIRTGGNFLSLKDELIESKKDVEILENPFEIIKTPESIVFEEPKPEVIKEPVKLEIEKNQVTLYEYQDHRININSYAYFEKENLVVDYWKLSDNYEDEYFTLVKKENLDQLYREFEIKNENKAELLIGLMNAFKGENCFEKVKEFFKLKNISFENIIRHDEK